MPPDVVFCQINSVKLIVADEDFQDENSYITKIMRKNHNFEAAYDFQIHAHYSTLLMSNKKNKLYHETSFYSSENLNVNEKLNNRLKPLMSTGTLDHFFHACTYYL